MTETPHTTEEQFEHLPWEELMTEVKERRKRSLKWLAIGSGVLVILVGFLWTRSEPGSPATPTASTIVSPEPEQVSEETAIPASDPEQVLAAPPIPSTIISLYSEAGVTAGSGSVSEQKASAYARWLLSEYFTADGSGVPPAWLDDPTVWPGVVPGVRSFVERLVITDLSSEREGHYAVTALMSRLVALPEQEYVRLPVQGVGLNLDVSSDPPRMLDYPFPTSVDPVEAVMLGTKPQEAPPQVLSLATDTFGKWGEIEQLDSFQWRAAWRVVAQVRDQGGLSWPMTLWFDSAGEQILPPAGD